MEGDFVLSLHEQDLLWEAQFSTPGAHRRRGFWKSGIPGGRWFPDAPLPQVGLHSRMHGEEFERLSVVMKRLRPFGVDWFTVPSRSRFRGLRVEDRFNEYHSRVPLPILRKVRTRSHTCSVPSKLTILIHRHVTIRTLLLRMFETDLKSSSNEELFVASLRTSAGGRTPHRGAAIGLVFERLIEEGRRRLSPSVKPKPSSTFESVGLAITNTTTTMTKSPSNTASSHCGGGGSETTRMSSTKVSSKLKKTGGKKAKLLGHSHSPPCGCDICKRAAKASKKS